MAGLEQIPRPSPRLWLGERKCLWWCFLARAGFLGRRCGGKKCSGGERVAKFIGSLFAQCNNRLPEPNGGSICGASNGLASDKRNRATCRLLIVKVPRSTVNCQLIIYLFSYRASERSRSNANRHCLIMRTSESSPVKYRKNYTLTKDTLNQRD